MEVKCPFKHRDADSVESIVQSDQAFHLNQHLCLKPNHAYWYQVQMQMHVYKIPICTLVTWGKKFLHHINVAIDPEFATQMDKMVTFHQTHICKELVGRRLENGQAPVQEEAPSSSKKYCYCKKPWTDEEGAEPMIGCDGANCKIEWFHYSCVGIKQAPKKAWYCKDCKIN